MDNQIISSLTRKLNETEENYPIGTSPRYIYPTRQSNFNNLEEELLMGAESFTEMTVDNATGNTIIKKEFHNNDGTSIDNNYYLLETKIFNDGVNSKVSYRTSTKALEINQEDVQTVFFGSTTDTRHPLEDTMYFDNELEASIQGDSLNFFPNDYTTTQEDILYFIKDRNDDTSKIEIIKKQTNKKVSNNQTIISERIINRIKGEVEDN